MRRKAWYWAATFSGSTVWKHRMASILVIDDEIVMSTALRRVLEDAGHEVTEAIDGNEGMARFSEVGGGRCHHL